MQKYTRNSEKSSKKLKKKVVQKNVVFGRNPEIYVLTRTCRVRKIRHGELLRQCHVACGSVALCLGERFAHVLYGCKQVLHALLGGKRAKTEADGCVLNVAGKAHCLQNGATLFFC